MQNDDNRLITAIYTAAPNKRVTVHYMMDDQHEFVACGDVDEATIDKMLASGGSDIDGWECAHKM